MRLPPFLFCLLFASLITAAEKPNIIYIVADDLGWKDVGYHGGNISTPHIDQLAVGGVELDQFYVQPICSPTRSSLMTGRYPMRLGMQVGVIRPWAKHGLPLKERTLPEALKGAGYYTAITGKWHLGHFTRDYLPTQRGFDHQHGHYNGALDYFTHLREGSLDWHRDDQPLPEEKGYTTKLIGAEAVRTIEKHDPGKPLFLYIPFNAPHSPFQAPTAYIEQYQNLKPKNRKILAAMITAMDDSVGQIVAAIDKRKWRKNTLILFHSDNGGVPKFADNGPLRGAKSSLYEGGVRVVALANWPGTLPAGGKITEMMHAVDMYPTLIGLAGGSLEHAKQQPLDGVDVWPVITKGEKRSSDIILINSNPFHGAVRVGDFKLVKNGQVSNNQTKKAEVETFELFNLAKDPFEKTDLSESMPEKLAEMKTVLAKFEQESAPPNIPPNRMPADFKIPEIWGQ